MTIELLALVANIYQAGLVPAARRVDAAQAIAEVMLSEEPLPTSGATIADRKRSTARLLFVWSYFESGWRAAALGDGGQSCGVMQTNKMWSDCSAVRKDIRASYRTGLRIMRLAVARCGSLNAALGMYASGRCLPGVALVRHRCAISGAC